VVEKRVGEGELEAQEPAKVTVGVYARYDSLRGTQEEEGRQDQRAAVNPRIGRV
jgi:hypothetical protein